MTPVDSPHVLLTRAADRLQELADKASPTPWAHRVNDPDQGYETVVNADGHSLFGSTCCGGNCPGHISDPPDAAWIATLSPAVASHLAAWLRYTASRVEVVSRVFTADSYAYALETRYAHPIALARTVLGMEAETP